MRNKLTAVLGAMLVALGAFGAHALNATLSPDYLEIWKTGVLYGFVHALAALFVGTRLIAVGSQWLCLAGTNIKKLGAITPGGVLMIAGWVSLAVSRV